MKEKKYNYVYITTNLINGKQYVGDHSTDRKNDNYLGSGKIIKDAIKKYGRGNFKKEILEFFETKQEAFNSQEKYIKKYKTLITENGYNISPKGGNQVNKWFSHSKETKEKQTISAKQRWANIEERIKQSERLTGLESLQKHRPGLSTALKGRESTFKGKKHTEEAKRKIGENSKGNTYFKGKKHTEEAKEKNRQSHLGKKHTEKTKKKMSISRTGSKRSIITKKKMGESRKKYLENNPKALYGKNNPVYGKICISNIELKQRKFIYESEWPNYSTSGWVKGMKRFNNDNFE